MVQSVTLPFERLNAFPGVSDVDNVNIDIPQVSDIEDAVDGTLPSLDEIQDGVRSEIDDALEGLETAADVFPDDIEQTINDAVANGFQEAIDVTGQIDVDLGQVVQDAILDALDVDEGLFGPLDSPIDEAFEQAVTNALSDLDELDIGLPAVESTLSGLSGDVSSLQDDIDGLSFPDVQEEVTAALESLPGATLLSDPDQFIDDQIDRVTGGLVDDDVREELEEIVGGGE